jgi:hypothetical protein
MAEAIFAIIANSNPVCMNYTLLNAYADYALKDRKYFKQ